MKGNRTRRSDFDYTWGKPISASGKQTVYLKVLLYLNAYGPSIKREILGTIKHINTNFESWRGYCSKMFSCMHFDHLIEYDPHTYRWSIGKFGQKLIEIALGGELPSIQIENIDDPYKTIKEMQLEQHNKSTVIGSPLNNVRFVSFASMSPDKRLPIDLKPVKPIGKAWEDLLNETGFDVDEAILDIDEFIAKLQMFKRQLLKLK